MSSAARAVKAALFSALQALFAADDLVGVVYGPRGAFTRPDLISVGDVRTDVDLATIGPNRARDEHHDVTVVFSVSRPGVDQQAVTERCYDLVAVVDAWLITSPNETLALAGGPQAWGRITELVLDEPDTAEALTKGRQAAITTTIRVRTRI